MPRFDDLTLQTVSAINELYRRTDELYHELARRAGVADCAFEIMYNLMEQDGQTQKQLCATSFATKQTVSSSIKRLQEKGLVEIRESGRSKTVWLTGAGKELVEEKIVPVLEAECRAVGIFDEKQKRAILEETKRYTDSLASQFDALRF